ncbi:YARHG domain-containing protein [Marinigracilibium pacificum]|uniref:YARHG domain-containing protein n=1 Tax=Marinigracilibium pacificum TaxID=2729599 RepID=A0A848JD27_9BACT|nr:YARHG domain-containing protein [Marinigracilibium pacificum]NMM50902.1 YARHG domain-containing protein [Marinigracilibium pacificum]
MRGIYIFLFSIIQFGLIGQSTFKDVNESSVNPWNPKFEFEYQSVYKFGDSEWESYFILINGFDKWYAQIVRGKWSEDVTNLKWLLIYENLTNVRIEGNKFYSEKTNGEFVYYDGKNGRLKGLKVYDSWAGEEGQEIGHLVTSVKNHFPGNFSKASFQKLDPEELKNMSEIELKIMRNEIFARYHYKFKEGGEMDKYFKKQNWYSGYYDDVTDFLTELEIENIELIKRIENN